MESLSNRLGRHHRECDALFADAESAVARADWSLACVRFGAFRAELEGHFAAEESLLFPRFEAVTGITEGPTRVMRSEHAAMREALARVADALARQDADDFAGEGETLFILLQQHNMKEESVLYPMCDLRLGAEAATLGERMEHMVEEVRI
ncbi:MAG: hemerythrin domain-containing protein [Pseudazoarcus pumilus]|mgnify:CR=1 FL=1|nr:hemerythrin domain-containing protein [Pseudazoarcus pumilus]